MGVQEVAGLKGSDFQDNERPAWRSLNPATTGRRALSHAELKQPALR